MSTDPAAVSLVGGGPGELDLLTLDAEAAIVAAREIVADRSLALMLDALAAQGVVTLVDDDQAAVDELLAAVRRGPSVVRLYRGDPWFHPAGDAERAALTLTGVRSVSVPGVVEELALAAAAGIPVQVRTHAVTTTFAVDALDPSAAPGVRVPAEAGHTLVVRTTDLSRTAARLADRAQRDGVDGDRPAAALPTGPIADRAEPVRATLATLASRCPAGPGVVVVGVMAALDTRVSPSIATATR